MHQPSQIQLYPDRRLGLTRGLRHLIAGACAWQLVAGSIAADPPPKSARNTFVVRAVSKARPSVVNISTERIVEKTSRDQNEFDVFESSFERFFGRTRRQWTPQFNSLGSGVVIDASGLILTNDHVIQRASRIVVTLSDGSSYDGIPVASSSLHDLALLRLQGKPATKAMKAVSMAAPDDLLLGEPVITIGNPFGLGHSVAVGVLSARNRHVTEAGQHTFEDILQTDAAINPGNSGGPLINADGNLIGVNLAMDNDADSIGFAIPAKRLESVLSHWLIPSRFGRGRLGIIPMTHINKKGILSVQIAEVLKDSPAEAAGLKAGDQILSLNGKPVRRALDFGRKIWRFKPAHAVTLGLAGGKKITLIVDEIPKMDGAELARNKLSLELQNITPRLAEVLGLQNVRGLVVSNLIADGNKSPDGLQRGDVITKIGDEPVSSLADVERALGGVRHGDTIKLVVHRTSHQSGSPQLSGFVLDISL